MTLFTESLTPKKSRIIVINRGRQEQHKIEYINKKGTFKAGPQCVRCKHLGKVQIGLMYAMDVSCDRDGETWRARTGKTTRVCSYYEERIQPNQ